MLYQLSYASPSHPEKHPDEEAIAPKNCADTLLLHDFNGTEK